MSKVFVDQQTNK